MHNQGLSLFNFLFLLFIFNHLGAQIAGVDHWEAIISPTDNWKYHGGTSSPGIGWHEPDFDDADWPEGNGSFGYGDDDDSTIISKSAYSVFQRISFNIKDTSQLYCLLFRMDFDDGFVAYLNGIEIARENLGFYGTIPNYNDTAFKNAEAQLKDGVTPNEYLFYKKEFKTFLHEGQNLLAIQTHVARTKDKDLTSYGLLYGGLCIPGTQYKSLPDWFREPLTVISGDLPIIKINTHGLPIDDEIRISADLSIINNTSGKNSYDDTPTGYNGRISIEKRGSSSQRFPKKSYSFETQDQVGENLNYELLGLPAENDWVLYAPYSDKTLLRNAITYSLHAEMGHYAPRFRFCEVFLNGTYCGIYLLTEKIKQDKNRVDIAKVKPTDTSGVEITGGYLFKIDKSNGPEVGWSSGILNEFFPDDTLQFLFHDPEAEDLTIKQRNYLQTYVDSFEFALKSEQFMNDTLGYRNFIDVESFVDYFIINEITKNVDGYRRSAYFYKRKSTNGGKIHAGPIWDYNLSLANSFSKEGWNPEGWFYQMDTVINKYTIPFWWRRFLEDPYFINKLNCRWNEFREGIISDLEIINRIDSLTFIIDEAQERNFKRWDILGKQIWPNYFVMDTFDEEKQVMEDWLLQRLAWIDNNLSGDCVPEPEPEPEPAEVSDVLFANEIYVKTSVQPNPFSDELSLMIYSDHSLNSVKIIIYDIFGKAVQEINRQYINLHSLEIEIKDLDHFRPGIYLYTVIVNELPLKSGKLIKIQQ